MVIFDSKRLKKKKKAGEPFLSLIKFKLAKFSDLYLI